MRKSTIVAVFKADRKTLWDIITNNEEYSWRSDLERIEILENKNQFIEYTKGGFNTTFTITQKQLYTTYAFTMENQNFKGNWKGVFFEIENGGTRIEFTEEIEMKNTFVEILSYIIMPLKKMQKTYIRDLKRKLGE